ncbi:hypothetical protein GCM10010191_78830 [Actinomadura vinacea]|uniref:DUF397 domain-containing protein n=1 Tax=Actinomadura vinacea TaxID=115336 RepID=A0ABP5X9G5_9ACTN
METVDTDTPASRAIAVIVTRRRSRPGWFPFVKVDLAFLMVASYSETFRALSRV